MRPSPAVKRRRTPPSFEIVLSARLVYKDERGGSATVSPFAAFDGMGLVKQMDSLNRWHAENRWHTDMTKRHEFLPFFIP